MKDPLTFKSIDNKHTDDLVDHYWGTINYVFSLIKASEIKAGLVLSFYGILLNFIYQNSDSLSGDYTAKSIVYSLAIIWFGLTLASIYYSIRCFMPQIESKYEPSIFFFKDIISKFGDIKQFSHKFYHSSLESSDLFDQLGQQIYINAKIADVKFINVNKSLRFLVLGLLVILLIILIRTLSPT